MESDLEGKAVDEFRNLHESGCFVLAPSRDLSLQSLEKLGVRRISVGSAMARVAWGAFERAARTILETGRFDSFAETAPHAELNELFGLSS